MKPTLFRLVLTSFLVPVVLNGEYVVYDFEPSWQFEDWETNQPAGQSVTPSEHFVVGGKRSARFEADALPVAPVFKTRVWENDWEPYDRLAMDFVNPTGRAQRLEVFVGDEVTGYTFRVDLPPLSHLRKVAELKIPENVRKENINQIVISSKKGRKALFYVDNIALLREGEPPMPEKGSRSKDMELESPPVALGRELNAHVGLLAEKKAVEISRTAEELGTDLPEAATYLSEQVSALRERIDGLPEVSASREVFRELTRLGMTADRFGAAARRLKAHPEFRGMGYLVGHADAMVKVMPKHLPVDLRMSEGVSLSLAGGEKEGFQVAVMPFAGPARDVRVEIGGMTGPDGAVLNDKQTEVDLVGFVKTEKATDPDIPYIGWWPDVLIPTDEAMDVAMGDVQTWWVRIRAPRDQTPGVYTGAVTVSGEGAEPYKIPVKVTVRGFNVPPHAPIPTAITYVHRDLLKYKPIGTKERWEELKYEHTDFLAEYMMGMDSLYRPADTEHIHSVDWDLIRYMKDTGRLVAFNLGYLHGPEDKNIDVFRPNYEKAKELGVLDHAYIYGFDERGRDQYPKIEAAARRVKEEYPEVKLVMTTAQDHSYGFDSVMKTPTGWCPILSRYNPTLAEKAREIGREIWYYTCVWPPHPYPNIFVEYPNIENRILSGLMLAHYRPDGYLYYQTTMWADNYEGVTDYPYTNWNPNSFGDVNGDGLYFLLAEDGSPLATVRVENYRDGLEDLSYYMILQHQVNLLGSAEREAEMAWKAEAEEALAATGTHIRSRIDWTDAPEDLQAYRTRLAELIEASPVKDTNPWKDGMGVLGLDWWN